MPTSLGSWLRCMLHCVLLYQPPRVVTYAYKPVQLATLYDVFHAALPATQVVTYAYKPGQLATLYAALPAALPATQGRDIFLQAWAAVYSVCCIACCCTSHPGS
jgi:hypothetical protein